MRSWSIIIFCYNELGSIEQVVEDSLKFLHTHATADSELIIVDDCSIDGTTEKCMDLANLHPQIQLICHPVNMGIGAALRSGYHTASKEVVCAIPGDGQFEVWELAKVIPFNPDCFYSFYREANNYGLFRKLLHYGNKYFNLLVLGFFLKDVNWIKVYSLEQLNLCKCRLHSSLIESELSAKLIKAGYKVVELTSEYKPRVYGNPKGGSFKTILLAFRETLKLFCEVKRFKGKKFNI